MPHFEQAIAASQGARRYQEDAAAVWPHPDAPSALLAVLADGMGGHVGGAKASQLVCEKAIESFRSSTGETPARLTQALIAANKAIARTVDEDPALSGMGSTMIAAVFDSTGLEWVSVGDSPLYLFRHSKITLLNEDHSLAPALDQMAAEGRMTLAAARSDPRRHMLRSAVTGEDLELVDVVPAAHAILPADVEEYGERIRARRRISSLTRLELVLNLWRGRAYQLQTQAAALQPSVPPCLQARIAFTRAWCFESA